jgi:2,4-dienoyl-CoA reductase-like NADH-dependent reductase (Old Yellow Enzyme family)
MTRLEDPLSIGGMRLPNRLYRAPLLECAGNGPDAVDALVEELEPAAAAGTGLICQGATLVCEEGGCVAPNMTRVADRAACERLAPVPGAVHRHGGRIVAQLEHGGLRSMETWHAAYRREHPGLEQLAVSRPPAPLRAAARAGLLAYDVHVLSTAEVRELAADFGRAAAGLVAAGYDGIHVAGANMGIAQQFLSPFYNRRSDEFGGSRAARVRFLELLHDEVRDRAGDVPLLTKVPVETAAPPFVRRHLTREDALWTCERLAGTGYDALVPVRCSTFWDMSIIRGSYPDRAFEDESFRAGYREAFGGPLRTRLVKLATQLESRRMPFEPAWNGDLCRAVRRRVDVPVLCEGGIRERPEMDRLLGDACDAVGVGRPFYAEPRLAARLLDDDDAGAVCRNCNNCVVPQAAGEPGVCRTPDVLAAAGELRRAGAYEPADGDDGVD